MMVETRERGRVCPRDTARPCDLDFLDFLSVSRNSVVGDGIVRSQHLINFSPYSLLSVLHKGGGRGIRSVTVIKQAKEVEHLLRQSNANNSIRVQT